MRTALLITALLVPVVGRAETVPAPYTPDDVTATFIGQTGWVVYVNRKTGAVFIERDSTAHGQLKFIQQ